MAPLIVASAAAEAGVPQRRQPRRRSAAMAVHLRREGPPRTRLTRTSRTMLPPMPVSMPSRTVGERVNAIRERLVRAGHSRKCRARAASKRSTTCWTRLHVRVTKETSVTPATSDTATYRQSADCGRRHGPEQHVSNHPACVPRFERGRSPRTRRGPRLFTPAAAPLHRKHERPHEVEPPDRVGRQNWLGSSHDDRFKACVTNGLAAPRRVF